MSKEKDTQQILLQEDFLANHSALQESEKEQQMIATSGMKCLESLGKLNQGGLLEKMLKVLLTSTMAWYSDRCKLIWKTKVSKANVLLFQLQASVHGIKEKECGSLEKMWRTPTAEGDAGKRGLGKMTTMEAQEKNRTITLSRQMRDVDQGIIKSPSMYPTPTASDIEGGAAKDVQIENGHFFRENKKGERWGVKLRDAIEMYPTPVARDYKDAAYNTTWKESRDQKSSLPRQVLKDNKPGGKLNPEFVEFLMGYPMNWTKVE